jgi:molecular chaperone IbpA
MTNVNTINFPTLTRFGIGFDTFLNDFEKLSHQTNNYPPYNIVQVNEDEFLISLAVSGFKLEDLTVIKEKKFLIIEGKLPEIDTEIKYLHRGISGRNFKREFQLADYVDIEGAKLETGVLTVHLKREIPEAAKAKTIEISNIT